MQLGRGEQSMEPHWVVGTPVAPPPSHSRRHPNSPWLPIDPVPHPSPSSHNHGNPYVQVSPAANHEDPADTILKALGRCGRTLEATTRRAIDVAGSVWNHLRTSPNPTDAAISRLYQETKAYAEGGHDKIFRLTFGVVPGEKLLKSYACYLSTSSGPLQGTLYLSTLRLGFCSDVHRPVYGRFRVVLHLGQLRDVNSSSSASVWNPNSDRYIQIVSVDGRELWFMGFVSYDKALKQLKEALLLRASY